MENIFEYTNDWFEVGTKPHWDKLIPKILPTRVLEIGSYEGAATCYLIDKIASEKDLEIHCIDTWDGGIEHRIREYDMSAVENRFIKNTQLAIEKAENNVSLNVHKGFSDKMLSKLFSNGKENYFDFIFVDGSHDATDVLLDATLSYRLCKLYGYIGFDDYLWFERSPVGNDLNRSPKLAIDAFTSIYCRKIRYLKSSIEQIYVQKL